MFTLKILFRMYSVEVRLSCADTKFLPQYHTQINHFQVLSTCSNSLHLLLLLQALELERSGKESLVSELTDMKTKLCEHETNNSKALLEVEKERKSTESRLTGEMNAHKVCCFTK